MLEAKLSEAGTLKKLLDGVVVLTRVFSQKLLNIALFFFLLLSDKGARH